MGARARAFMHLEPEAGRRDDKVNQPTTMMPVTNAEQSAQESVLTQIARLQTLTHEELKERWRELYGAPPPPVWNRPFLLRRLAYRIQELAFGGLPEETRQELERIAEEDAKARPARKKKAASSRGKGNLPVVGTRLVRRWQTRDYEVIVVLGGYEFEGTRYGSLSAIAKKITGTHWNGRAFFGLKSKGAPLKTAKKGKRKKV
jgi:hypothetical protein